jgi:AraC-like DNA-binding protein
MLFYNRFAKNYPITYRTSSLDISADISVIEIGHNRTPAGLYQTLKRDVYILHYIESGKGIFMDTPFDKSNGYLVVPKELEVIISDNEEPYESCWIMFRGSNAPKFMAQLQLKHNSVFSFKYNRECINIIKDALFRTDYSNEYEEAYNLQAVFYKLIAMHTKDSIEKDSMLPSIAQKVANYIEKSYYSKITISDIAQNFHISRNYLYTLFKQEYGVSPQDYLISYRIEMAKKLLKNTRTQLSINEVATSTGFENPLYFSRLFRNRTGMSPSAYKKQIKQSKI